MANMLSRNKNIKPAKKTQEDHAEDALYREISEEVHAEKLYSFVKKHLRLVIAGAILIVITAIGIQLYLHQRNVARDSGARLFESALISGANGDFDKAQDAFARAAAKSDRGMADLALWESAMMGLRGGKGTAKLEQLAADGATRDFRDLALIRLSVISGNKMDSAQMEKFLSPVLTDRSPFYYTGMLLVAQKYLASGDSASADKWLNKIINDKNAPSSISAMAQMLR